MIYVINRKNYQWNDLTKAFIALIFQLSRALIAGCYN